jgi:PiT family inorganic phosphate transporter
MQAQIVVVLLLGAAFGALNGMNDGSVLVGTLCSSRAMTLVRAQWLAIAGIWLGVWMGADIVSRTVCLDLVRLEGVSQTTALNVWMSALGGALCWGWLARRFSIPSSATHSFIGAICGATLVGTESLSAVNWSTGVGKVFLGLLLSPLLGGTLGFLVFRMLVLGLQRANAGIFGRLRQAECGAVLFQSICYGMNDAHSVMGLVMGASLAAQLTVLDREHFLVPWPIKLMVSIALTVGALLGSRGMLQAVARGLYLVRPPEALAAQSAAALAVYGASFVGAPVSSSQVNSSALIGVGGAWRPLHVRWRKVWSIVLTWVITFPGALCLGALVCALVRLLTDLLSGGTN